jgi:hypothetical protein
MYVCIITREPKAQVTSKNSRRFRRERWDLDGQAGPLLAKLMGPVSAEGNTAQSTQDRLAVVAARGQRPPLTYYCEECF